MKSEQVDRITSAQVAQALNQAYGVIADYLETDARARGEELPREYFAIRDTRAKLWAKYRRLIEEGRL